MLLLSLVMSYVKKQRAIIPIAKQDRSELVRSSVLLDVYIGFRFSITASLLSHKHLLRCGGYFRRKPHMGLHALTYASANELSISERRITVLLDHCTRIRHCSS